MKMGSVITTLVSVVAFVCALMIPSNVHAWNPQTIVQPCTPTFNTDWFTSFKTYSANNATLDEASDSFVVYKTTTANTYWIVWENTGQIEFNSYSQATYGDMNVTNGFYATISDTTGANINAGASITNSGFAQNATCISYANNVNYTNYIGTQFPVYTAYVPPPVEPPVEPPVDDPVTFEDKVAIAIAFAVSFLIISMFRYRGMN